MSLTQPYSPGCVHVCTGCFGLVAQKADCSGSGLTVYYEDKYPSHLRSKDEGLVETRLGLSVPGMPHAAPRAPLPWQLLISCWLAS